MVFSSNIHKAIGGLGIKKAYRLKSKKQIAQLMKSGTREKAFPLHLVYSVLEELPEGHKHLSIAVSVPKRIHRSAVDRNAIKRRMREGMRPFIPNLVTLMENEGHGLSLMFIYVGIEKLSSVEIQEKIKLLLNRFQEEHNSPTTDE